MAGGVARLGNQTLDWIGRRRHPFWRLVFRLVAELREKLAASAFSRNVSVMLIGTMLGQAMSVLLAPALTRLYTPEQFGALGVYMSTLNILVVVAALRYEIPMSTARTPVEVVNLLVLSGVILVFTTSALAVVTTFIPRSVLAAAGVGGLDDYRLLLPVGFAFLGAYYIMLYYATWAQEFAAISRTRISQGLSGPLSQIVLGLLGLGAGGLAAGFVIGQSSGTLLLFNRMVIRRMAMLREVAPRRMLRVAWQHRGFPLISSWAGLIDVAGAGQLVYILASVLYPGPVAGYMFIAERVVARPLQMFSTSMLTVFMAEIGRTMNSDPALLRRRFLQVTSKQLMVGLAWVLVIDIAAVLAFPIVFGISWADAVPFVVVLSIAYLINSVVASVGHTLQVLRRQKLAAAWQVGRVLAVCLGFVVAVHLGLSAFHAICIYSAIQVVACCVMFLLMKISIDQLRVAIPAGVAS
jgi:O-antigen/teichoic acid export membrane protein